MDSEGNAISHYLEVETEYMPAPGFYTDSGNVQIRSQAVSIIAKHSPIVDSDAYIAYLAMNYFDRYFSTNQFQDVQDVKSDSEKVRLIALCCLFISAKMRIEAFSRVKYKNFTQERIMEMEISILKVLDWRMLPVTPFVYLNYYYRFVQRLGDFKRRCINEIIVQAQGENEFVCYKPSIIVMSAFLVAAKILYPSGYNKHRYEEAEGKKEELFECVRALRDLCDRKNIKIEPPHDELIATKTDEVGNKTHLEEELLEAGTTKGEAKKPTHDEVTAILTDEIGNKTNLEEGSLEREQKAISNEIVETGEEEKQRLAKGKAVVTSNEEKRRLAKGKMVAVSELCNKTDLEEGSLEWEQKAISKEIVEIDEEEEQRLAKGKAVAMVDVSEIFNKTGLVEGSLKREPKLIPYMALGIFEELLRQANGEAAATSNEKNRRLAKGKAVATSNEKNRRLAKGKMVAVPKICNKTNLEEGSSKRKHKTTSKAVLKIYEDLLRQAKYKSVATSNEENRRLAKGKMVAVSEICNKTDPKEGSLEWEQKAISNEIVEIDEEEEQRLAKGKAVATSNEESRRLAKGKMVAVPEIFDGERQRQPPKSISEEEKKKLEKEEQEKIDRLEVIIKLAMEKGKLEKGMHVGRSLRKIINEPEKPMNFDLKW